MSLFYFTRNASEWYDGLLQVYKKKWSLFFKFSKNNSILKNAYHAQIEALSFVKTDNGNVRHYALKVETLIKQG